MTTPPDSERPGRNPALYERNEQLLAIAIAEGNETAQLALSLVVVADNAMIMKTALNRIYDLYDGPFDDLSSNAGQYVPIPLAARIDGLKERVEELFEHVDSLADESREVMTSMAALLKKA